MKSNYKKIGIIFSLLFILLISLAMVSAEEIASDSDDLTLSDDVDAINNDYEDVELESAEVSSENPDSNLNDNSDVIKSEDQEILNDNGKESKNVLGAVADSYTISVKNVSGTENTNVNIVATVKKNSAAANSGYVVFALWTEGDDDIVGYANVENGQAVLNIKLPSVSKISALKWICDAYYTEDGSACQASTTFMAQIKRAVNPTTVLTSNIVGKMGKKVTLVAKVYDTDGLKVNSGTLTFTVNGKSYKVSVKNGKASKTITTPFLGIYTVKAKYNGIGAYKPSSSKFKLASDLKMKYSYYKTFTVKKGAKKYYKITLTNYYTKKPLKSFKIKFKVKTKKTWKTYNLKSNSKGIIKWSTKKLSVGTHNVKICSPYKYMKFTLKGKIIVKKK